MDQFVFLAVLGAALLHAGWNSVIKSGNDPFATVTHLSLVSGTTALFFLPFVSPPGPSVWPWLALSALLHTAYRLFLIQAYKTGDLVHVYPIARGAAPLITAIGTLLLIGESIGPAGFAGVAALSLGVFLMSLRGGRLATFDRRTVGFALCSALATAGYSLVDGIGARINGSGPGFALWMFVGNMLVMQALALALKGPEIYRSLPANWVPAVGGGIMSMSAYFIVIWAMTKAPIALVAALRETSVLFAGLISMLILKEPLTAWRAAAALVIVAGVVMMRLG
jgi:drug/metabolite transporter (DMT)-like permease